MASDDDKPSSAAVSQEDLHKEGGENCRFSSCPYLVGLPPYAIPLQACVHYLVAVPMPSYTEGISTDLYGMMGVPG